MDVKEKNNTEKTNAAAEPVAEDLNEVMRIRREKLAALVAEGKNPFEITKFPKTHDSSDVKNDFERLENTVVSLAGRIISVRIMGKASFCHILDGNTRSSVSFTSGATSWATKITPRSKAGT